MADFQISEQDFFKWMERNAWHAIEFEIEYEYEDIEFPSTSIEPTVYPVRLYDKREPLEVKHGYAFFTAPDDNPDMTKTVIYDLESKRAYLRFTSW